MRAAARAVALLVLVAPATRWACAAFGFDGPSSRPVAWLMAAGFAVVTVALFVGLRPLRRATASLAVTLALVIGWWLCPEPRGDRDRLPDVAHPPQAEIDGDRVTTRNLRDFDYRSESDYVELSETQNDHQA